MLALNGWAAWRGDAVPPPSGASGLLPGSLPAFWHLPTAEAPAARGQAAPRRSLKTGTPSLVSQPPFTQYKAWNPVNTEECLWNLSATL